MTVTVRQASAVRTSRVANPQLLAPLEEREAFAAVACDDSESGETQRMRLLGMFLGRAVASAAPSKKVVVAV